MPSGTCAAADRCLADLRVRNSAGRYGYRLYRNHAHVELSPLRVAGSSTITFSPAMAGTPVALTSNASYPTCTAPCMISVAIRERQERHHLLAFLQLCGSDTLYVGDGNGNLQRIHPGVQRNAQRGHSRLAGRGFGRCERYSDQSLFTTLRRVSRIFCRLQRFSVLLQGHNVDKNQPTRRKPEARGLWTPRWSTPIRRLTTCTSGWGRTEATTAQANFRAGEDKHGCNGVYF